MCNTACKNDLQTIKFAYLQSALDSIKDDKACLLASFLTFMQRKFGFYALFVIFKKDNNLIIMSSGFLQESVIKNINVYDKIINNKKALLINKKLLGFSSSCFFPYNFSNECYLFSFFKKDLSLTKEQALEIKRGLDYYFNFLKVKSNNVLQKELLNISQGFLINSSNIVSKTLLSDMVSSFLQGVIRKASCFKSVTCYEVTLDKDSAKVISFCSKDKLSAVNYLLKKEILFNKTGENNKKLKSLMFQDNKDKFLVVKTVILNQIYSYVFVFEMNDNVKYLNYEPLVDNFLSYIYFLINLKDNKKQEIDFEKLVSISYLSSGTVHYINNFMQGVTSRLELIKMGAKNDPKLLNMIEKLNLSLQNCKDFFKLYTFLIANQSSNIVNISFTDFIYDLYAKFQIEYGDYIDLEIDSLEEKYLVECDEEKLFYAIWAVLVNALEFSYQDNINIKLNLKYFFKKNQKIGNFLKLTIEDIGRGMSKDVLLRAFEPFFSTKSIDRKTRISPNLDGLGLTISKSIISSFGGYMDITSLEGKGTSVKIVLPIKI